MSRPSVAADKGNQEYYFSISRCFIIIPRIDSAKSKCHFFVHFVVHMKTQLAMKHIRFHTGRCVCVCGGGGGGVQVGYPCHGV